MVDTELANPPQEAPPLAMRFWYFVYRMIVAVLFPIIGPVRVYGLENIPREGPVIFVSNHSSYLDPPVIGWKPPRFIWAIGKKELLELPIMGPYFRAMGVIPVDQTGSSSVRSTLRAAVEQLEKGRAILIFPEGTRTRGPIGKGQPGAAMIARKTCAPIIPVLLTGTHRSLSPDHPGIHRGRITCTYGKPFQLPTRDKLDLDADVQLMMDTIADLRKETPNAFPEIREEELRAES